MTQTVPDMSPMGDGTVTEDRMLSGRVRLRQGKAGYRAGMDAALLAAACDALPGQRVVDVGCGPGAVMLAAAVRLPLVHFVGIERDAGAVGLARENIALNSLEGRAEAIQADVGGRFAYLGLQPFDAVLCNPPFFDDPDAIRGPAPERTGAYMADAGLQTWIEFLLKAVREGGTITVIHRADRLRDLLALLGTKAGSMKIRPIHPFADTPAKRVLVRAVKTGKGPLNLLTPLILHDRSGAKHTHEAEAILRGDAALGW